MENEVQKFYGNRLRVRSCGICIKEDSLLMVNHFGITHKDFWAPPGGGIQFGEHASDCLIREFKEETGLSIEAGKFMFACEFIQPPLHAIEVFFEVSLLSQHLRLGADPEKGSPSIIRSVKFMPWNEIEELPSDQRHGIFNHLVHPAKIITLNGYFKV
jgi:8-oxo-dGTP diphosphatase